MFSVCFLIKLFLSNLVSFDGFAQIGVSGNRQQIKKTLRVPILKYIYFAPYPWKIDVE